MTMNTPPGLVLFSQEQKKDRALPKGAQCETAQGMMISMFDGLKQALGADLPKLRQTPRIANI